MISKTPHQFEQPPLPWRPINEAPKTGERLVLFYPAKTLFGRSIVVVGKWCHDTYVKRPAPYWECDLSRSIGVRTMRSAQPTHWMSASEPSVFPRDSGPVAHVTADSSAIAFVRTTAALVKDGEDVAGEPFDMPSDQAVDTLADLINEARAIIASSLEKRKETATWPSF